MEFGMDGFVYSFHPTAAKTSGVFPVGSIQTDHCTVESDMALVILIVYIECINT
jgi:hypothetical protein